MDSMNNGQNASSVYRGMHPSTERTEREKARDRLLEHPEFQLLYVGEGKGESGMKIVRPALDSDHSNNIRRKGGFFALSHLWGNAHEHSSWRVGDFISEHNDAGPRPVEPVPMRPEKRSTLVALLKTYPGSYWWIDVLCARVDTPLVIMRFIYAYCTTCFAIVDCPPPTISSLCDQRLEPLCHQLQRQQQQRTDTVVHGINEFTRATMQHTVEFLGCRWFDRVWTLQEMTLPARLIVLSETCDPAHVASPASHVNLCSVVEFGQLLDSIHSKRCTDDDPDSRLISKICGRTRTIATSNIHRLSGPRDPESVAAECIRILSTFKESSRQCSDPRDYIYGVLGLLDVHIPRIDDTAALWRLFLFEVQIMLTWAEHRHPTPFTTNAAFNLQTANNLGDVYTAIFGPAALLGPGCDPAVARIND